MRDSCIYDVTIFLKANTKKFTCFHHICVSAFLSTTNHSSPYQLSRFIDHIKVNPLFSITYVGFQGCEEFCLTNLSKEVELFINHNWPLEPNQQICLTTRNIKCAPIKYKALATDINLAFSLDPEALLDLNDTDKNHIKISYAHKQIFKCFDKIEIICE